MTWTWKIYSLMFLIWLFICLLKIFYPPYIFWPNLESNNISWNKTRSQDVVMWRNVATWSAILVLLWISKTLKTVRVIEHRLMPLASGQWGTRVDKTDQWGGWWLVWHTGPGLLGMGWVRSCDFYRPVSLSLSLTVSPVHCDECLHNISSWLTTQWQWPL